MRWYPGAAFMDPDAELLSRWRAGDTVAGNQLLSRHFGSIRRFFASKISGNEVEDLVQQTFAACIGAADTFRGDARFSTFLFSIARNQLYRYLRNQARDAARTRPDLSVSSIRMLGQSPTSVVARAQNEDLVLEALQRLSVEQQTMLELHYWENLRAPELAIVLDIQPGTVRTRLHRARVALQEVLKELVTTGADAIDIDEVARALGVRI
ncbi:MAG: RNA polymerase sigma factor [Deltaproteobacteria bacterium]|nr:RNA polymerase sigma factor [Deltaproteobacteria bacterium]